MGRIKAFFFRERAHETADVTRVAGARLITRMLRDLGRELGLVVEDVVWLPDPGKQRAPAYVLTVTWGNHTRQHNFPHEYLDGVTESDVIRRRTAAVLKSLLDEPSIWRAQGQLTWGLRAY